MRQVVLLTAPFGAASEVAGSCSCLVSSLPFDFASSQGKTVMPLHFSSICAHACDANECGSKCPYAKYWLHLGAAAWRLCLQTASLGPEAGPADVFLRVFEATATSITDLLAGQGKLS